MKEARERLAGRKIGFIGAGNMARALAEGLLRFLEPDNLAAADPRPAARDEFRQRGLRVFPYNRGVVEQCDILILAVKPQVLDEVLGEIGGQVVPQKHLVISIAAGVPTGRLESFLPVGARVVRVMPNTPMLVGRGVAVLCGGTKAEEADLQTTEALFSPSAVVLRVEEKLLDAATGLSGSGPAYLFYLVEALVQGGVEEGFTPREALLLAAHTMLGAAHLLVESGQEPAKLRQMVTSPGGATEAAIRMLEAAGVGKKLAQAVQVAAQRSRQLASGG